MGNGQYTALKIFKKFYLFRFQNTSVHSMTKTSFSPKVFRNKDYTYFIQVFYMDFKNIEQEVRYRVTI